MRYRFAMILVAAALPLPALAQQAVVSADSAGSDRAAILGKPKPVKTPHRRYLKSGQAGTAQADIARPDPLQKATPDVTRGGTTGAAGGIVPSPAKIDPEVHNLNTVLPP
jgi:hypothetical protein